MCRNWQNTRWFVCYKGKKNYVQRVGGVLLKLSKNRWKVEKRATSHIRSLVIYRLWSSKRGNHSFNMYSSNGINRKHDNTFKYIEFTKFFSMKRNLNNGDLTFWSLNHCKNANSTYFIWFRYYNLRIANVQNSKGYPWWLVRGTLLMEFGLLRDFFGNFWMQGER